MTRKYFRRLTLLATVLSMAGSGCSTPEKDSGPTLKSLEKKTVRIERDAPVQADLGKAKESYKALLKNVGDDALKQRAMRRLADLEMQEPKEAPSIDTSKSTPATVPMDQPDYRKAIDLYENLLKTYPNRPDNDRVLYQLSRAYELTGNIAKSADTLGKLVSKYPQSRFYEEAQFRRGELLFSTLEFESAEKAYADVLKNGRNSPFYERATYKHGWSLFKQEKFWESLPSFFALLDLKLANKRLADTIDVEPSFTQADKELLKDAFRVVSFAFAALDRDRSNPTGAAAKGVEKFLSKREPTNYEFLIYRNLGDHFASKELFLEAADTYRHFSAVRPYHPQSILLMIDGIEIFQDTKEGKGQRLRLTKEQKQEEVRNRKKELVERYGKYIEYWRSNTHHGFDQYLIRSDAQMEQKIEDYVIATLQELGNYFHGQGKAKKDPLMYQEAAKWYQTFLRTFLNHPRSPEINFKLAQVLEDDGHYAEAIREYEKTAYNYPRHEAAADAGHNALLTYEKYKKLLKGEDLEFWNRLSMQSAQRFTKLFPKDPRSSDVLAKVVDELYARKDYKQASEFAKRILAITDENKKDARLTATLVLAHADFDDGKFQGAQAMYDAALKLMPKNHPERAALEDRLAASIYKQGEQLKEKGKLAEAASVFATITSAAPTSAIAVNAQFDTAALLLDQKDWAGAIQVLERFLKDHPNNELAGEATAKLAVAYRESGDKVRAADYIQKVAASKKDPKFTMDATWEAAGLYEQADAFPSAIEAYKRFAQTYASTDYDRAIEARQKIIDIYGKTNDLNSQRMAQEELVKTVTPSSQGASDRARVLAGKAALELARPSFEGFKAVQLRQPLKDSVPRKKQALDKAEQLFNLAAEYRVAEVTTAATYHIGQMYKDLSTELLKSERPAGMSAEALEQYELVLEEQADPIQQKAVEIHEVNAARVQSGIFDEWVRKSFTELATLLPARYGKLEKYELIENVIN